MGSDAAAPSSLGGFIRRLITCRFLDYARTATTDGR